MQYEKPHVEIILVEEIEIITASNLYGDEIGGGTGANEGGSSADFGW